MEDKNAALANALEALHMNEQAIRAAIEDVALWLRARGSENTFQNTMIALQALDTNAETIAAAIECLRS
ncbi:hypothetical protein N5C40_20725 [Pseudomonas fulva]|uniref:hypothetical protein n=1 Tax=Pseudomonas fulva TaxID=47880 RepID=UPI001F2C9190|nr:hypothetical protein [Pseudomonas fulva]MDH1308938.1 hypothetical protein [Pseudomonas fulva]